jgi:hypothetical protein
VNGDTKPEHLTYMSTAFEHSEEQPRKDRRVEHGCTSSHQRWCCGSEHAKRTLGMNQGVREEKLTCVCAVD